MQEFRDVILKNLEENDKSQTFCKDDVELFKSWKWMGYKKDDANVLSEQGWNDLRLLASKYKRVFPQLFDKKYNSSDFLFKHTQTSRTKVEILME